MTPQARSSVVPKLNPLELLQNFGVLRNEAWDKYFMNEKDDIWFSKEDLAEANNSKTFPFNLTSNQGKSEF